MAGPRAPTRLQRPPSASPSCGWSLFIGWFGPRGLASLVFALLALEGIGSEADGAVAVIAVTVLLSVLTHGVPQPRSPPGTAALPRVPHRSRAFFPTWPSVACYAPGTGIGSTGAASVEVPRTAVDGLIEGGGRVTAALSLAVIVLVPGAGVAESAPNPDGTRASANGDFAAQGMANVARGLFRGIPVGGVGNTALSVTAGAGISRAVRWMSPDRCESSRRPT